MRRWLYGVAALLVITACGSDHDLGTEPNAAAAPSVGSSRPGTIPGQYIVVLKDGIDGAAVAAEHASSHGAAVFHRYQHALKGYAARLSPAALAAIEKDDRVRFVSEDREVYPASICAGPTFNQPDQCLPAGTDRIDGDRSSTRSGDGRGAVNLNVAVLDSGIDPSHPDLNIAGGVACANGQGFADQFGHGTGVAGIIGAKDNGIGVVGVAPGVRLWAVRVISKKSTASHSDIICGIDWVTSTHTDSDPTNDIAVTNMSLEESGSDDGNCGKTNKDAVHLAICNSSAAGVSYVVSAGNDSQDLAGFTPAAYDEVLTVTAMGDFDGTPGGAFSGSPPCQIGRLIGQVDDRVASFSNFATLPADRAHTVAAPGVCVFTTLPLNIESTTGTVGYDFYTGTSQASPQVTGTVALCIASGACAGLTPAQIIQKIVADAATYNTAHTRYGFAGDPIRPETGKHYGYLIDAAAY
jgi:subtilisin family serine protease